MVKLFLVVITLRQARGDNCHPEPVEGRQNVTFLLTLLLI